MPHTALVLHKPVGGVSVRIARLRKVKPDVETPPILVDAQDAREAKDTLHVTLINLYCLPVFHISFNLVGTADSNRFYIMEINMWVVNCLPLFPDDAEIVHPRDAVCPTVKRLSALPTYQQFSGLLHRGE